MHEAHDSLGNVVSRELVTGTRAEVKAKLRELYDRDSANPHVASISQRAIVRNGPCWCGSGKKFKKCCWPRMQPEAKRADTEVR